VNVLGFIKTQSDLSSFSKKGQVARGTPRTTSWCYCVPLRHSRVEVIFFNGLFNRR
jgi:hypothetical protein